MLDPSINKWIDRTIPDVNPAVAEGVATVQCGDLEHDIYHILKEAEASFPENVRIGRFERMLPEEMFAQGVRKPIKPGARPAYDLAKTDVIGVKFTLVMQTDDGPVESSFKPIYVPVVGPYNRLHISGTSYTVVPSLTHSIFQWQSRGVFVQVQRGKFNVSSEDGYFIADNKRQACYAPGAPIHNKLGTSKERTWTKAPPLIMYLFARYGVVQTFSRYLAAEVVIGDASVITEQAYPPDEWVICSSHGVAPKRIRIGWTPADIYLAIRRADFHGTAITLIGNMFYAIDRFAARVNMRTIDDSSLWRVFLGIWMWGSGSNEGQHLDRVNEHLQSLEDYLASSELADLRRMGFECEQFFDMLAVIIANFSSWHANLNELLATMWGMRVDAKSPILAVTRTGVNTMGYRLRNIAATEAARGRKMTQQQLNEAMRCIKTGGVFKLTKPPGGGKGVLQSMQVPCDLPLLRATSAVCPPAGRGDTVNSAAMRIHVSLTSFGVRSPTKAAPRGDGQLSPFVRLNNWVVVAPVEDSAMMEEAQRFFKESRLAARFVPQALDMEDQSESITE